MHVCMITIYVCIYLYVYIYICIYGTYSVYTYICTFPTVPASVVYLQELHTLRTNLVH